jgi:hypothetical protein
MMLCWIKLVFSYHIYTVRKIVSDPANVVVCDTLCRLQWRKFLRLAHNLNFLYSLSLSLSLSLSVCLQRHYSPGCASASLKSFLHPSRFRATTVQFLHPSFAASFFTQSSQRNLGVPLGRFPPGSLRRILVDRSSSSWRMTCPAHLNLLSLQNFTISFSSYNW